MACLRTEACSRRWSEVRPFAEQGTVNAASVLYGLPPGGGSRLCVESNGFVHAVTSADHDFVLVRLSGLLCEHMGVDGGGDVGQREHLVHEVGVDGGAGHAEVFGAGLVLRVDGASAVDDGAYSGLGVVTLAGENHGERSRPAGDGEGGQQQVGGGARRG